MQGDRQASAIPTLFAWTVVFKLHYGIFDILPMIMFYHCGIALCSKQVRRYSSPLS
ncbi:unnamed protein product [Dovyalis caffra]|uniref:Uncharacterized protein n=1 Tax=Dovyalis caffra TaxID=77055 RepID=A0AAV1SIR7_9ROSI|nr:unnamed protein product [Dovyalis caffra]